MEHLIQLVQDHPVLYDTSNEDYMRGKMKDEIWDKIAKELNYTSGKIVKAQWKKLRDCFRDALRRQSKKRSGQGATVVRPWVYQKQMEFLIPYMSNRSTFSNLTGTEDAVSTNPAEVDEEVDNLLEENNRDNDISVTDLEEQENSEESQTINKGKNKKIKTYDLNEAIMKSINSYEKRATARDQLRQSMAEKEDEPQDPLYQFFMSMYNTTKNMPLPYQLRVKRKVFDTVSKAEEDIMTCNMTSESRWVLTSGSSTSMSMNGEDSPLSTYWSDVGKNPNNP